MSARITSPRAILALLTGLNFLNYLDRILVAAVLPKMSAELGLSDFQGGLTATVFLLGYFVTAPVFSALAARYSRRSLIAFGVATWSVATALSGTAANLGMLLAARAIVAHTINAHAATVTADNQEGAGAKFIVVLPAAPPEKLAEYED